MKKKYFLILIWQGINLFCQAQSKDFDASLKQINKFLQSGEYALAVSYCNDKISYDKENKTEWMYYLGITYDSLKQYSSSVNAYIKAVFVLQKEYKKEIPKQFSKIYVNLTNDLYRLENFDEAFENYKTATEIDPGVDKSYMYFIKSQSALKRKDTLSYLSEIAQAISLNNQRYDYYLNRAVYYENHRLWSKSIDDYKHVLQLLPNHIYSLLARGRSYIKIKEYKLAEADFRAVMQVEPENKEAKTALYDIFELCREKNAPQISLFSPDISAKKSVYVSPKLKQISIKGQVKDESRIKSLTINNIPVTLPFICETCPFQTLIPVDSVNQITIKTQDIYDNKAETSFSLYRDPPRIVIDAPQLQPDSSYPVSNTENLVELYGHITGFYKEIFLEGNKISADLQGNFHLILKVTTDYNVKASVTDIYDSTFVYALRFTHVDANATLPAQVNTNPDLAMRGNPDPLKGLNVNKSNDTPGSGNYYALFIGIDKYSGVWPALKNATADAKSVQKLLSDNYKLNLTFSLYDEQATRTNILNMLEKLVNTISENDNLLIYYSGHGEYKQKLNKGFWVPFDAKTSNVSDLISNNDIQTFLASIKSKHTLLISDACFSGDIFRGSTVSVPFEESEKYYRKAYNMVSRQALTSGGVEPVLDGGKEGHSVFAYYLLRVLSTNDKKYFDASQLFETLRIPVINNSEQTPMINHIKNTSDEGGQFIFIKK